MPARDRRIIALVVFVLVALQLARAWQIARAQATGSTWYVSRNGSGADGRSWAGAWREMNQIAWGSIAPGDLILIDGGPIACAPMGDEGPACGMVYNTMLAYGQNGVAIRLATDPGRNGTAILDGNQSTFTYCAENSPMPAPPRSPAGNPLGTVVSFNGRSDAILDGGKWGGIVVRNGITYGINLGGGDRNTVRFVKVHHINNPNDTTNNSVGITHSYTAGGLLLEFLEIYRNGQDAIRLAGDQFTLRHSYIHDHFCNHPDGLQGFVPTNNNDVPSNAGLIESPIIEGNIFERIGLQQIFIGENSGHQSWAEGAIIRGNLFLAGDYLIKTKHGNSRGWLIEGNTFAGSSEFGIEWCCANPGAQAPMTIRNNVFSGISNSAGTGFFFSTGGGSTTFAGNCVYQSGRRVGQFTESGTISADPLFIGSGDYGLQAGSPCAGKGAAIGSLADLIALAPADPPTPTPSPSATPTASETPSPTSSATATASPSATPSPIPTETPTPTPIVLKDCTVTILSPGRLLIDCPPP